MSIQKQHFGFLPNGTPVSRYLLQNKNGMTVALLDYAGAIQQLLVPDREGRLVDVVGGYDDISHYVYGDGYQGSLVGRIGNRIKEGKFTLEGTEYTTPKNNNGQTLHGGDKGLDMVVWDVVLNAPKSWNQPRSNMPCGTPRSTITSLGINIIK